MNLSRKDMWMTANVFDAKTPLDAASTGEQKWN